MLSSSSVSLSREYYSLKPIKKVLLASCEAPLKAGYLLVSACSAAERSSGRPTSRQCPRISTQCKV